MQVLTTEEIINKIGQKETFEAKSGDLAFYIKIEKYVPFICTALHNGHQLRSELTKKCLLTDFERWYEEDPCTLDFISDMPIVLSAIDSRYEYDLNRGEEEAIYTTAWGKTVWKEPLDVMEKKQSVEEYRNFYRIAETLIGQLEAMFRKVFVFDIHSYNYRRIERETPLFNLGTEGVDDKKFKTEIDEFLKNLRKIELRGIETTVKKNDVFQGRGHFTIHVSRIFRNTLVFPLEIKKVYCDELTGEIFQSVVQSMKSELARSIYLISKPLTTPD